MVFFCWGLWRPVSALLSARWSKSSVMHYIPRNVRIPAVSIKKFLIVYTFFIYQNVFNYGVSRQIVGRHICTVVCRIVRRLLISVHTLISLITVEVGINVEGGIFWKKLVHNCNKQGVEVG